MVTNTGAIWHADGGRAVCPAGWRCADAGRDALRLWLLAGLFDFYKIPSTLPRRGQEVVQVREKSVIGLAEIVVFTTEHSRMQIARFTVYY